LRLRVRGPDDISEWEGKVQYEYNGGGWVVDDGLKVRGISLILFRMTCGMIDLQFEVQLLHLLVLAVGSGNVDA
jgi:hypothetical protein